jgi:hypothetical protein
MAGLVARVDEAQPLNSRGREVLSVNSGSLA